MTSQERVEARFAPILVADVAGYSRLMGEEEEVTLGISEGDPVDMILEAGFLEE